MTITTAVDYTAYAADTTAFDSERVRYWLPVAERWVARQAGRVFYDAAAPESDASQDWRLVVCMVVEHYLRAESPERLAAANSPYKQLTRTDGGTSKSYTVKDDVMASVADALLTDARIAEIIAAYTLVPATPVATGVVLAGPTRTRKPTGGCSDDFSRRYR